MASSGSSYRAPRVMLDQPEPESWRPRHKHHEGDVRGRKAVTTADLSAAVFMHGITTKQLPGRLAGWELRRTRPVPPAGG